MFTRRLMKRNSVLAICLGLTAMFTFLALAATMVERVVAAPHPPYATTITVDSSRDVSTSMSERCNTHTPCTLRRAIVQARLLAPADRPVLIQFNIPTSDPGYNATLKIWELEVKSTADPAVFRTIEGGQITIDGTTQPGGRTTGPKIILVGPSTGNKNGLIVGVNATGAHDGNVVRGLGFQNFKDHVTVNSNNNLIEQNWFGLTSDGQSAYLRGNNPQNGSGAGGLVFTSSGSGNTVQDNVFLGLSGVAVAVRGTSQTISGNFIGTRYDGQVTEKQTDPTLICTPVDWLGGSGISVADTDNTIADNVFAGIRIQVSQWSLQADTIRVSGQRHTIQNNRIGLDVDDTPVGVCGRGIYLSDGPKNLQILHNQIVDAELSAISLNGILYDANTLRGNVIAKNRAWPQIDGSARPEDAIQVNPSLPDPFENFVPAKVTDIDGVTVKGSAGSPCANCVIELFLDDTDDVVEALASLAVVTANAQGNWTATLPAPLTSDQGIRTTSTTAQFNTIANISAGTTSGLSDLYVSGYDIYLPLVVR
jgi:hypothetical protein